MSPQITYPPLLTVAMETERYVAAAGWDQPPRLFALVPTRELLAAEPGLGGVDETTAADLDDEALSAIEQDDLPPTSDLEELLSSIGWPPSVGGVALAVERVVLPPEAEASLPDDPAEAGAAAAAHPDRAEVRLLVAVARDGESVTLLRQRAHDEDDKVATGADIAPGLVAALRDTLTD